LVPLRVGLVTSVGSAAHADFVAELSGTGYAFVVLVVDARTQGPTAAAALAAALRTLTEHDPDVVALVRGGGAQTDLAAFDGEVLATAIATSPFPVLTGIGHEIDSSVADHVAARSFKTPTACAQGIVEVVRVFEDALAVVAGRVAVASVTGADRAGRVMESHAGRLGTATRFHVVRHARQLEASVTDLGRKAPLAANRALAKSEATAGRARAVVRHRLATDEAHLDVVVRQVVRRSRRSIGDAERRVDGIAAIQRVHDPSRLLARGWSLTYHRSGRLVRDPSDVAPGERIRTRTAGGEIGSVVELGGERPDV
jgi:exodeoxyribonuclease VII large subunit